MIVNTQKQTDSSGREGVTTQRPTYQYATAHEIATSTKRWIGLLVFRFCIGHRFTLNYSHVSFECDGRVLGDNINHTKNVETLIC